MSSPPPPAQQQSALYTDCQACRITGTLTFSAVGLYALTAARAQAKTPVGRGVASLAGCGFLAVAAARWTTYEPAPPMRAPAATRSSSTTDQLVSSSS
ncbi:hypothetical protein JCM8202_001380 [Rhodotorula sphaerocarpa]